MRLKNTLSMILAGGTMAGTLALSCAAQAAQPEAKFYGLLDLWTGSVENPAADDDTRKEAIKKFDDDFVALDQAQLFDMILAANYLDIKDLLELTCEKVASMIKGKTPEEIRKEFNIQNDFTPAEEDEIRKENQWAFE